MRNHLLVCISLVMLVGCSQDWIVKKRDSKIDNPKPTPVLKHAPAAEIWEVLAQYVEHEIIQSPSELAEYVKGFLDNEDLTTGDNSSFESEFPKAAADVRLLDVKADAAKLRGIK